MSAEERATPDYAGALAHAKRVAWSLDEVLPEAHDFDFSRPFLPEALVEAGSLAFLDAEAARALSQVRARGYLDMFGQVEEAIVPFVLEHLEDHASSMTQVAALANFAGEELKHIELFRRFAEAYDRGRAPSVSPMGRPGRFRSDVLGQPPLAVGLLVLHVEWMTQRHYLAMARRDTTLEPAFKRLLHSHWLEECQHARLDVWMVGELARESTDAERRDGFEGYLALVSAIADEQDGQAAKDLASLEAFGLAVGDEARLAFVEHQARALRRTYVASGLSHPRVREVIEAVHPPAHEIIDQRLARWS